jgi:hypothetical protein
MSPPFNPNTQPPLALLLHVRKFRVFNESSTKNTVESHFLHDNIIYPVLLIHLYILF